MAGEFSMSMQMTLSMENIRRAPPPCTYRNAVYNCAVCDYSRPAAAQTFFGNHPARNVYYIMSNIMAGSASKGYILRKARKSIHEPTRCAPVAVDNSLS